MALVPVTSNDGAALMAEVHGAPSEAAGVVLLVHGWSGSRRAFLRNIPALAAEGLAVVAYDQRFHGDSAKPDAGFHVARLAMDLHAVLTELKLENVTAVGTSMGAAVLWSFAELFGTKPWFKGIVTVDQAPLQNRRPAQLQPAWDIGSLGCYDAESYAGLVRALQGDMRRFAAGNVAACATLPLDDELLAVLEEDVLKCVPMHLAELMYDHTAQDWRNALPLVTCPVLNLAGAKSGIFPVEGVEAAGAGVPDGVSVVFEQSNHWLYMEEAGKFNSLVRAFATTGSRPANMTRV